jgi:hypothetical protein
MSSSLQLRELRLYKGTAFVSKRVAEEKRRRTTFCIDHSRSCTFEISNKKDDNRLYKVSDGN